MPEMLARFACAKGPAVSCRSYLRYLGTLPYAWLCESEGAVITHSKYGISVTKCGQGMVYFTRRVWNGTGRLLLT